MKLPTCCNLKIHFCRSAYEEDDVLIGPPPPAMIAEADNVPDKERFDEVSVV
jgi:hypothetical protein